MHVVVFVSNMTWNIICIIFQSQENKPEVYRPMENGKKRQIENTLSPPSSTKALKTGSSVFNSKIATTSSPAASKDSFEQICGSPVLSMETISFPIYSDPALVTALNDGNRVSTEDRNRVVRNQLTMMRAECANLNNPREPGTAELKQVAEALILKYPALSDDKDLNPLRPWVRQSMHACHQYLKKLVPIVFICKNTKVSLHYLFEKKKLILNSWQTELDWFSFWINQMSVFLFCSLSRCTRIVFFKQQTLMHHQFLVYIKILWKM